MKPLVYLESSLVSYLTAQPSRDLIVAAHQQLTRDWWLARDAYSLFVSQVVVEEAGQGDPEAARRRLAAIGDLPLLEVSGAAVDLASALVVEGAVPAKAPLDALHIAVAAVHGMHYVLTWNFKHLANAAMRLAIEGVCARHGYGPPVICTPEELLGGGDDVV